MISRSFSFACDNIAFIVDISSSIFNVPLIKHVCIVGGSVLIKYACVPDPEDLHKS